MVIAITASAQNVGLRSAVEKLTPPPGGKPAPACVPESGSASGAAPEMWSASVSGAAPAASAFAAGRTGGGASRTANQVIRRSAAGKRLPQANASRQSSNPIMAVPYCGNTIPPMLVPMSAMPIAVPR